MTHSATSQDAAQAHPMARDTETHHVDRGVDDGTAHWLTQGLAGCQAADT